MERIDLPVEPLKNLSEEEFKPFGQIFGLEKGAPTEDYSFIKVWWSNIDTDEISNDKIRFNYGKISKITPEETVEAKKKNQLGDWLDSYKGYSSVSIMERHPTTSETFFFMEGDAIFVMAPPDPLKDSPDLSKVRAFLLDSSLGVFLSKGTWHWPPIPVYDYTRFAIVCQGSLDDFDRVDLDAEFKLVY